MKYLFYTLLAISIVRCTSSTKSSEQAKITDEKPEKMTDVSSDDPFVFFRHPADGATVPSPVYIEMGVSGMQVEPAGKVRKGYGHHHILINQRNWPEGSVIPMSDSTIHYGKGQTDASLELPAGEYTLSLQFADGVHASYGKKMATSIRVKVE